MIQLSANKFTLMLLPSLPYNIIVPLEYYCRFWVYVGNDCTHIAYEYVCDFDKYVLEYVCTLLSIILLPELTGGI